MKSRENNTIKEGMIENVCCSQSQHNKDWFVSIGLRNTEITHGIGSINLTAWIKQELEVKISFKNWYYVVAK